MSIKDKPINETRSQIPDTLIEDIVKAYDFSSEWHILPIIPINGHLILLTNKSETTRKAVLEDNNRVYILKEVPWYCSEESFVRFMLDFQKNLLDNTFPTPKIITTVSNEPYVSIGNTFCYIQEFVRGDSFKGTSEQIYSAGINLAKLHQSSRNISHKDYFNETIFGLSKSMTQIILNMIKTYDTRMSEIDKSLLTSYSNEAREYVTSLETHTRKEYNKLSLQVHGDYNPLNMLFDNKNNVISTFDYENTTIDNPVHDVAEGILDFCCNSYKPHSTRFSDLPSFNEEKFRSFIAGYSNNNAMYKSVEKLIPEAISTVFIELFSLGIVRGDYDFDLIPQALPLAKNFKKYTEEIIK